MIYLILIYVLASSVCLWAGWLFYQVVPSFPFINKNTPPCARPERPVISYLLSGLILLTGIGQWLVLFIPLDKYALSLTLLILLLFTLLYRKSFPGFFKPVFRLAAAGRPLSFFLCLGVLLFMILVLNAGPTIMDDTESYHIQMVKWIQQYGTVPGIANLHLRFGFNSSWFISIGLLSPKVKGIDHYLALNGLLSCWLCHYLLDKSSSAFSKNSPVRSMKTGVACIFLLIIGLASWPMIRGNAATANYDFITTCCILVLFVEYAASGKPAFRSEWIIWPFFLCTVRMMNAPLLVFAFISLILVYRHQKRDSLQNRENLAEQKGLRTAPLFTYAAMGAFLLVPFIARNTILSGYPLFPAYQLDPFSFDWKVSRPLVVEISEYIKYYNRSNGSIRLVNQSPFPAWISVWHEHLYRYDKILTDVSLVCWLGVLACWKKWGHAYTPSYTLFMITMLLQLVFWLLTAPDPRFAYGPLLAGIFSFILLFPATSFTRLQGRPATILLSLLAACVFLYSVRKTVADPEYRNWWVPRPLPVPTAQTIVVDGIRLQIPDKVLNNWNPRCYDLDLPCLYKLNPLLRARGKNIRDGFRLGKEEHTEQAGGEYKFE